MLVSIKLTHKGPPYALTKSQGILVSERRIEQTSSLRPKIGVFQTVNIQNSE